jgi:hypothetical protein
MTVALGTQAVNVLNLYLWEVLKLNTSMKVADYGGKIPIIPGGQDPDFNQYNKPYLVYGWSEDPSSYNGAIRGGTLVYAIYSTSTSEINAIMNVVIAALSEDDAARRINKWSSTYAGGALVGITFTDARIAFGEGASPADQEGGREVATLTMRYEFKSYHSVNLNV